MLQLILKHFFYDLFANCPQAASMSFPLLRRTLATILFLPKAEI